MNYVRLYRLFIASRRLKEVSLTGYAETHHIQPRSLGGSDDAANLIRLSAEDHFFAHLLLAKAHGGEMWYAVVAMTMARSGRSGCERFLRRTRKIVALARERAAEIHSSRMKGRFAGELHPMFGKPCSELARQKTRERHAAGLNPMNSADSRRKLSESLKGRKFSEDWKRKISSTKMGQPRSLESRKKQSLKITGVKRSAEFGRQISLRQIGKKKSPEQVQNMREANLGKKLSAETRAKISKHWAEHGHPKGMLGKVHGEGFKAMMTELNRQKREYAKLFGVSARAVTRAMIVAAGPE